MCSGSGRDSGSGGGPQAQLCLQGCVLQGNARAWCACQAYKAVLSRCACVWGEASRTPVLNAPLRLQGVAYALSSTPHTPTLPAHLRARSDAEGVDPMSGRASRLVAPSPPGATRVAMPGASGLQRLAVAPAKVEAAGAVGDATSERRAQHLGANREMGKSLPAPLGANLPALSNHHNMPT
jgi:hypothetical protein